MTDIRKASAPVESPRARSRVRWGRRLAAIAWKRTSGARATISTLKMNPAAAAPSAARTNSAPELTMICSLSMITSTAAANAPPRESVNSGSVPAPSDCSPVPARLAGERRRLIANGITAMLAIGAAAIPIATTSIPSAIPSATASANSSRALPSKTSRVA